jgi:hypothetical protein
MHSHYVLQFDRLEQVAAGGILVRNSLCHNGGLFDKNLPQGAGSKAIMQNIPR